MRHDRAPVRRSQGRPDQLTAPLEGIYERPVEGRLVRQTDGRIIQRCESTRPGHTRWYLRDITEGAYLGSLFTDNQYPEFDHDGVRYAIVPVGENLYAIQYLRHKRTGGTA